MATRFTSVGIAGTLVVAGLATLATVAITTLNATTINSQTLSGATLKLGGGTKTITGNTANGWALGSLTTITGSTLSGNLLRGKTLSGGTLVINKTAAGTGQAIGHGTTGFAFCWQNTAGAMEVVTIVSTTLTVRAATTADGCRP